MILFIIFNDLLYFCFYNFEYFMFSFLVLEGVFL